MIAATVFPMVGMRGKGWSAIARVRLPDGGYITQGELTGITCTVKRADGTQTYSAAVNTTSSVFDSLQTGDARWKGSSAGFNFAFEVPASAFSVAGHHRVEFVFDPSTGQDFGLVFEGPIRSGF
jgi:hypothetical protein